MTPSNRLIHSRALRLRSSCTLLGIFTGRVPLRSAETYLDLGVASQGALDSNVF